MAEKGQIAPLSGSMNMDHHPKVVDTARGQVFSRLNMRPNSLSGKQFANVKIKGTVNYAVVLPAGTNKVIGWIPDRVNESVLYFIYNSQGSHCVLSYRVKSKEIARIFYAESDLDLEDNILRGFVAEGDVYWVNGSKAPKQFTISRALNYTNNLSGDSYSEEDRPFSDLFSWIKKPPVLAPTPVYSSLSSFEGQTINFNNIRGKIWQFKYNYRYKNNQESAYSSVSKIPLPEGELLIDGNWVSDIRTNNAVLVTINTGGSDVKEINIAARDSSDHNSGDFFVFETVKKFDENGDRILQDNIQYIVTFLNNKPFKSIATSYGNRYFDNVPLSASDAVLIGGKWPAVARGKFGYDHVYPEYTLEPVYKTVDFSSTFVSMRHSVSVESALDASKFPAKPTIICDIPYIVVTVYDFEIPDTFYANAIYQITVPKIESMGNPVVATYTSGENEPANYPESVRDALFNEIAAKAEPCLFPAVTAHKTTPSHLQVKVWGVGTVVPRPDVTGYVITDLHNSSVKGLKRGQYHPFGIIYNDGFGRYNTVFGDQELFSPEIDATNPNSFQQVVHALMTITSKPPVWAKSFRVAYNYQKSYTLTKYVTAVDQLVGQGGDGIPLGKTFLKINQALDRVRSAYPHMLVDDYVWQKGDRIKRAGYSQSYEIGRETVRTYVNGQDTLTENGFVIDGTFDTLDGTVVDVLEIYRPNTTPVENIYFETGDEYLILNPGTEQRAHSGNIQNQSDGQPAIVDIQFGDVYYRQRLTASGLIVSAYVEDEAFSDYYISSGIDIGRQALKVTMKQKILNRVDRGENYLEDTETNRLNIFLSGTAPFDVSNVYGDITGIEEVGEVLKVVQVHKETSVYIGKLTAQQADGSNIIMLTDKVFGGFHRFDEVRGTSYRRSMAVNDRYLYYFDEVTGEFIRSAPNGQIAISKKYLLQSWFEAKAKHLREYTGHKDVIVAVDNDYDEVIISFVIGSVCETVVFSEKEDEVGWKYFIDLNSNGQSPENMAWYGNSLLSFKNGQLYLHNVGALNNFYGEQKGAGIVFISNGDPASQKRLKNIEIRTDKNAWYGSIESEASVNYPRQKTIFHPAIIREVDGRLAADILNNIVRRDGSEDIQLLYNGHSMNSDVFKVYLNTDGPDDITLQETIIKYLIST